MGATTFTTTGTWSILWVMDLVVPIFVRGNFMATQKKREKKKPSKPYPSFPLTAHPNGQWCKKIDQKVYFFGVWADPQAAFDRFHAQANDLYAGRIPRVKNISANGPTVKFICNHYLNFQHQKTDSGEISMRWFADCRQKARISRVRWSRLISPARHGSKTADFFYHRM